MSRYTLKKNEIIRNRKDFERIFKSGTRYSSVHLTLIVHPSSIKKAAFLPQKRLKNAVLRNRIKRLLREVYRKNKEHLNETKELIFIGRKNVSELGFFELEKEVLTLFRKINGETSHTRN